MLGILYIIHVLAIGVNIHWLFTDPQLDGWNILNVFAIGLLARAVFQIRRTLKALRIARTEEAIWNEDKKSNLP